MHYMFKEYLKESSIEGYFSWSVKNDDFVYEYVLIDKIFVPIQLRREGLGKKLLNNCLFEIQHELPNLEIKIAAYPDYNSIDLDSLVKFFENEGFETDDEQDSHAVIMTYNGGKRNFIE